MTPKEKLTLNVEVWKKIVDVQQHFNDLELRIRNFSIGLYGVSLGTVAVVLKEKINVTILNFQFSIAVVVAGIAILAWLACYLMDRFWYHRLLMGAVKQGARIESSLKEVLPGIQLTKSIGDESPIVINACFGKVKIHSTLKMDIFYGLGVVGMVGLLVVLVIATGSIIK